MARKIPNINDAILHYETWSGRVAGPLVPDALKDKHERMRTGAFVFLRASFYRFAQRWPLDFPDLNDAPTVPSVGDAHLENFGTWLDARKRLIWGINDFDEAFPLPFTFDLLRLATSVAVADVDLDLEVSCAAILRGYRARLEGQRGLQHRFVVEDWPEFRAAIAASLPTDPRPYWSKYRENEKRIANFDHLPKKLLGSLQEAVPKRLRHLEQAFTRQAGTGSLGRYRLAVSTATDGPKLFFGIEAKRAAPSACIWAKLGNNTGTKASRRVLEYAQHIADPGLRFGKDWVVRRLDPRRQRFSLGDIPKPHEKLLEAMGVETANIHLGDPKAAKRILKHLDARGEAWLPGAARQAAEHLRSDQKAFSLDG